MTSLTLQTLAPPVALADKETAQGTEPPQYLTFHLGEEMFAMSILAVREIIEYHALTTVPLVPALIRGVINLRGSVVPVIDLAVRFGRSAGAVSKRTCIVMVETNPDHDEATQSTGAQKMGIVVDAVSEVLEIAPDAIEPPPEFGTHLRPDFIKGMVKINQHFVVLLDIDPILSLQEIAVRSALELE
ncbi:MAG: chemotaxis protein CheW [Burkholderiaceae bacterium]|nr:chemotaxis protein CheW [Burkholderiaceae bacterium]